MKKQFLSEEQKKHKKSLIKYFLDNSKYNTVAEVKKEIREKIKSGCESWDAKIVVDPVIIMYNNNPHFYLGRCWLISCHHVAYGHSEYIL
ncbi:hypothetical protein [Alistipes sp. CHKCI003]|uniref:Uncharacterized protein n=1 Tax=Candidatus Scatousia excrementigallinarum TaxID=2840935 RepID=A0A9D1JLU9_9BACT|nr:hypothetical protein [Alistipes sp. CHKCI003]CVI68082.1 hypothetical protein BN3659_01060 [Alistipes sp. CHKCI003]HIS35357.1 hypothetical protein [Candidatus Scatousia excrementigallinarum]